jgi:hypothetical protein
VSSPGGTSISSRQRFLLFLVLLALLLLTHLSLLRLPYFWDESGYYIPAARDIFLTGSLVPQSTPSNAHTPLVLAYLAAAWKLFGYSPAVTRVAMLLIAAFTLFAFFELARAVANFEVAVASTICLALYPVFFAQSSLAHLDLAATGFTLWGTKFYLQHRPRWSAAAFTLAALSKETAIIAPLALLGWEILLRFAGGKFQFLAPHSAAPSSLNNSGARSQESSETPRASAGWWLLLPAAPLAAWFAWHHHRTGYLFGNPEYFRYNVAQTLQPLRIFFAALRRAWQLLGHMNLYVLTLAAAAAMFFPPQFNRGPSGERRRIPVPQQMVFLVLILAYWVVFSLIGGAVLARYMLAPVALVILICVSTIRRRVRGWPVVIALIAAAFVEALFVNPPVVFAPEDNLAYRDYIQLHQQAADFVGTHFTQTHLRVLTAWPAADELSKPFLGYVHQPITVIKIENFTLEQIESAREAGGYDAALLFSTKYQPPHPLWMPKFWKQAQQRFFDSHRDLPPEVAAQILGGTIVYRASRSGQWVAVVEIPEIRNAALR